MSAAEFPSFYSKVLLFGEYSLMVGSKALSIPINNFKGRLSFENTGSEEAKLSNEIIKNFTFTLQKAGSSFSVPFDFDRLLADLDNGLYFKSNIPQGYGVGSSGALVAALYSEYVADPSKTSFSPEEVNGLRKHFITMESYFHGKSSGLDPLICYLNKPVLVESKEQLRVVNIPESKEIGKSALFLLDTKASGETRPLVNYFLEQCKNENFCNAVSSELIPLNNRCIDAFLEVDLDNLATAMKKISAFTLNYFLPMIPDRLVDLWKRSLQSNHFSLKLCGSGGGGMMLGISTDLEKTKSEINEFNIIPIHYF
jgi:mevalonate kinase